MGFNERVDTSASARQSRARLHAAGRVLLGVALLVAGALVGAVKVQAQVNWGNEDTTSTRPRARACPEGKERNDDTDGQCCWPGQAWNGRACVGAPTSCPAGLEPDAQQQACVLPGCLAEMVMATDGKHCCWPGQAWSSARSMCIGNPECPESYVAQADGSCAYVPPDEDKDGVIDLTDRCPTVVEDRDGWQDLDGCPDADNDSDTFADAADQCPDEAEDFDTFQDEDGCPEPDNDKDGVLDVDDQCPDVAEDLDAFEDADGCPDKDNDRDGIADAVDQCPDVPEDLNAFQDADGCPDKDLANAASKHATLALLGWMGVGAGLAAGGASLFLHLEAESVRDEVLGAATRDYDQAITSISQRDAQTREDEANTLDTGAAIALGVGGGMLAAGTVLLLMRYLDDDQDETLALRLSGQEASIVLTGRF